LLKNRRLHRNLLLLSLLPLWLHTATPPLGCCRCCCRLQWRFFHLPQLWPLLLLLLPRLLGCAGGC
jgi:hypothetical protein